MIMICQDRKICPKCGKPKYEFSKKCRECYIKKAGQRLSQIKSLHKEQTNEKKQYVYN